METEIGYGGKIVTINLRKTTHGGSACQAMTDDSTQVSAGDLHCSVLFKDLGLRIVIDSEPGNWCDPKWARNRVFEELKEQLTLETMGSLIAAVHQSGRHVGTEEARATLRAALGL